MSVDIAALRAAQKQGLTVGVIPKDGSQAMRLEIDDLLADADLANLYFLALEAFMKDAIHKDPFSYYEISGIHGTPYRAWDGVTEVHYEPAGGQTTEWAGYCSHGSVLFPTWHRAYLAQFEQALFLHAAEIAGALGQTESVLPRFRIPFFDPLLPRQKMVGEAKYKYGLPIIFMTPTVMVRRPGKKDAESMDNPLYQFNFPQEVMDAAKEQIKDPKKKNDFGWIGVYTEGDVQYIAKNTIRGYDDNGKAPNHTFLQGVLDNNYNPAAHTSTDSAGYLYKVLLGLDQDWKTMSNHYTISARDKQPGYVPESLEGFHDNIHTFMGFGPNSRYADSRIKNDQGIPGGHMAYPEFAGFDPVFWLHHCNIDRILAIWQGINDHENNPHAWWDSLMAPEPTYVEPQREIETPKTPLAPFRKSRDGSNTVWWTSNDVRQHTKLGYDYQLTADARVQKELTPSEYLTTWANQTLGWADKQPGSGKNPAVKDKKFPDSRVHLEAQIKSPVPALPSPIFIDGKTQWPTNELRIASEASAVAPAPAIASRTASLARTVAPVLNKPLQQTLSHPDPSSADGSSDLGDLVKDGKTTLWNISFGVDKFALNGSFIITFFLGDFAPENAGPDWLLEPNVVSSSGIFASSQDRIDGGNCENCAKKQNANQKYYDAVGLTPALLTYLESGSELNNLQVTSLEPSNVVPFLQRNLHWRVIDSKGQVVANENIPSLKVMVYSETVVLPEDLKYPATFQNQVTHYEVTEGRPGGLNSGEQL